jgi:hypothetical protein
MAVVLCISADESLAMTRRMILQKAGHRVLTVFTVPEAEQACSAQPIDVAVIGQGVPHRERVRIRDLIRNLCPSAKLLELYVPSLGKTIPDADDWLEVPGVAPAELGERVSTLAGEASNRRKNTAH